MYELYTKDEQIDLIIQYRNGDTTALDKLLESYTRMIRKIASKYTGFGVEKDDLFQEGSMGFIACVDKFDLDKGVALSTFAYKYIDGYIKRSISNRSRTVRIPAHVIKRISDDRKNGSKERIPFGVSLDEQKSDNGETLYDVIEDRTFQNYLEYSKSIDQYNMITGILDSMPDIEALVLKMKFGIGFEEHNLAEIGRDFGMSRQRVHQIYLRAVRRFRQKADVEQLF